MMLCTRSSDNSSSIISPCHDNNNESNAWVGRWVLSFYLSGDAEELQILLIQRIPQSMFFSFLSLHSGRVSLTWLNVWRLLSVHFANVERPPFYKRNSLFSLPTTKLAVNLAYPMSIQANMHNSLRLYYFAPL